MMRVSGEQAPQDTPRFPAPCWPSSDPTWSAEQLRLAAVPIVGALGGFVGATWGDPACLVLALSGFAVQAWVIFVSQVRGLQRLSQAMG